MDRLCVEPWLETIKGNGETILSSMATIIQPAQRNLNINQALCGQHTAALSLIDNGAQRKVALSHASLKGWWLGGGVIQIWVSVRMVVQN